MCLYFCLSIKQTVPNMNKKLDARKPTPNVSSVPNRIMSPELTDDEKELIARYCARYGHTKSHGRGLLLAAKREMSRDLATPEVAP
jgi:hypothetical protein